MTEAQATIIVAICGGVWALTLALIATIWSQHKEKIANIERTTIRFGERIGQLESEALALKVQNTRQEKDVAALQAQNTTQESAIAGLVQRMIAREEAHAQHREDTSGRLGRIEDKLDRLLGSRTPQPRGYGTGQQGGSGGE
jgi:hypothetical protein